MKYFPLILSRLKEPLKLVISNVKERQKFANTIDIQDDEQLGNTLTGTKVMKNVKLEEITFLVVEMKTNLGLFQTCFAYLYRFAIMHI